MRVIIGLGVLVFIAGVAVGVTLTAPWSGVPFAFLVWMASRGALDLAYRWDLKRLERMHGGRG